MYFVQYKPLKQQLRNRSLSDRDALPYLILEGVVSTLLYLDISSDGMNPFDWVSLVLGIAITIGGTIHVYNQNGGTEGFDLVQKCLVLGWVVGFRLFLTSIPVLIAFVLFAVLSNMEDAGTDMVGVLLVAIYAFIFYERLGRHIRDTTAIQTDSGEQPILP